MDDLDLVENFPRPPGEAQHHPARLRRPIPRDSAGAARGGRTAVLERQLDRVDEPAVADAQHRREMALEGEFPAGVPLVAMAMELCPLPLVGDIVDRDP